MRHPEVFALYVMLAIVIGSYPVRERPFSRTEGYGQAAIVPAGTPAPAARVQPIDDSAYLFVVMVKQMLAEPNGKRALAARRGEPGTPRISQMPAHLRA